MRFLRKEASVLPFVILFLLLPFFEGGETPLGLFLFHSIVLAALSLFALTRSSLTYPRFVYFFFPFILVSLISTLLAPYRYAAALQLWDFLMAVFFIIAICGAIHRADEETLQRLPLAVFLAGSVATILSAVLYGFDSGSRISSSFVNPNEFACFLLIMVLLGIYTLTHESGRLQRRLLGFLLLIQIVLIGLTYSRTALLALLLVFTIHLWKRRGKTTALVLGAIVLVSGALLFSRFFLRPPDQFRYYRLKIWESTLRAVPEDPYLGIGLNMLSHSALRFNFPADVEVGRFSRVARSSDSQYLQLLIETGFLGFFAFLIGWVGLFLALRKLPERYFYVKQIFTVVSVFALFSLPLNNTSILLAFSFLMTFPFLASNSRDGILTIPLARTGRIASIVLISLFFVYGVYFPYKAHSEFQKAIHADDPNVSEKHLQSALFYNPFQPYYRFAFVKRVVDSEPRDLHPSRWLYLIQILDDSIRLNSEESNFYVYKARCWRYLLRQVPKIEYYTHAVSSYQAGIERDPYNPFLQVEFAVFLLFQEKNLSLAEAHIQRAIDLEPAYLDARLLMVELRWKQHKPDDARKFFHELEKWERKYRGYVTPGSDAYTRRLLTLNLKHKEHLYKLLF